MTDELRIQLDELHETFDALLEHVRERDGDVVVMPYDMFWAIPANERYDVYEQPQQLTIGQLSESWLNLKALTESEDAALGFGLVWLADILRAIGERTVG